MGRHQLAVAGSLLTDRSHVTISSRQARLRPEFAALYPGIAPGCWECASVLTDKVVALRATGASNAFILREFALLPAQFEFRERALPALRLGARRTRRPESSTAEIGSEQA